MQQFIQTWHSDTVHLCLIGEALAIDRLTVKAPNVEAHKVFEAERRNLRLFLAQKMPVLIPKAGCMQAMVVGDDRLTVSGKHDIKLQQLDAYRQSKVKPFEAILRQNPTRTTMADDPDGLGVAAKCIQLAKLSD